MRMSLTLIYFKALSPTDKLKARRRNLVSAKVGFYSFIFMFLYEPLLILLYYLPLEVGKSNYFSWDISHGMYTGVRSYLISTGADLLLCVVTPLVVIYNSSHSDRVRQMFRDGWNISFSRLQV